MFQPGGQELWDDISNRHTLTSEQVVQLVEACRVKDRLDALAEVLARPVEDWPPGAATQSVAMANLVKQLLAALRLPDVVGSGRAPRGAQVPSVPGGRGSVSSLERARARKSG